MVLGPRLPLWVLLFADDFNLTAEGREFASSLMAFVWWLVLFRVPLSWKKSQGGLVYSWVGFELSLRGWPLGISAPRAAWVDGWFTKTLAAGRANTSELREALGRMVYVYGALQYDKPFLAPLFTFLAVSRPGVVRRLPLYALVVMRWLRDRLRSRRAYPVRQRAQLGRASLRVDAKAEGLAVAVGGWAPHYGPGGEVLVHKSPWFHVRLTEKEAPWAFVKGAPARAISTLELLATLLGLVLLAPPELEVAGTAGSVAVTGLTDSQVSAAVVARGLTTAYPLCVVAMELAAQLEERKAELFLEWIPREVNQEADRLADGRFDGFTRELRVQATLGEIKWLVMDELLSAGAAFFRSARQHGVKRRLAGQGAVLRPAGKRVPLRVREPW